MREPRQSLTDVQPLPRSFFERETLIVARELLGHRLRVQSQEGKSPHILRIVETEAYTQEDPACHAYGRTTGRAATLYLKPGLAYVYLIYGMYHCLNVTTEPEGRAGAVLFRALEPLLETELRTHGPGRLTKALNITRIAHNEIDLTHPDSPLTLLPGDPIPDSHIVQTTRIGISQGADFPWRFYIEDSPWVSVRAKSSRPKAKAARKKRTASAKIQQDSF